MHIPKDVKELSNIFHQHGYDLFVVGGAVRDFILGKEPHDFDLVTNAQPNAIVRILEHRYRLGLHGRHFAVVRVFTKETPDGIEIASYRKDIAKGRDNKVDPNNPKVEFGRHITIRDDVFRRDLTCNALYYDIRREKIVDLVGGLEDIRNGIIRAVGNPRDRFAEDRLRILRVFRFASKMNLKIDKATADAITYDNRLNGISPEDDVTQERINEEFYGNPEKPGMLMWCQQHRDMESWIRYMNYLKEFKMFVRMYPDVKLNTNVLKTLNEKIIYTKLFDRNEPTHDFNLKMTEEFRLPSRISDAVILLLKIKKYFNEKNIEQLFDYDNKYLNIVLLYRYKIDYRISNNTISEYADLENLDRKFVDAFLKYSVTTDAEEIMKLGFRGKDLGIEIKRIETEKFKELI